MAASACPAGQIWEREVSAALRPLGLTYVQFALLGGVWWLETHGSTPSQRELSDHTGISPMLTSQVTRALEKSGLVQRVTDASDTRVRRLALSPKGRRAAVKSIRVVDAVEARFFASVGIGEELIAILQRIAGIEAVERPSSLSG